VQEKRVFSGLGVQETGGGEAMTRQEQFLSQRKRYQPIALPHEFSDEEMARDWTLSGDDREEIGKYRTNFRLFLQQFSF
jgi:hypothetical protein